LAKPLRIERVAQLGCNGTIGAEHLFRGIQKKVRRREDGAEAVLFHKGGDRGGQAPAHRPTELGRGRLRE